MIRTPKKGRPRIEDDAKTIEVENFGSSECRGGPGTAADPNSAKARSDLLLIVKNGSPRECTPLQLHTPAETYLNGVVTVATILKKVLPWGCG
jgi:hypothetical protein